MTRLLASSLVVLALPGLANRSYALDRRDVLVVYNSVSSPSQGVARYYQQGRLIADGNLLGCPMSTERYVDEQYYVTYIATPISNYLSTHPNIRVIVLCYGVPYHIVCDPWWLAGVDSALTLLGNPNVLTTRHWNRHSSDYPYFWNNPYYGKDTDFEAFRNSAENVVSGPDAPQGWRMNYLVCRLCGYSQPTTAVHIGDDDYDIPTDVKRMIDDALTADAEGKANLTNAQVVLDDAPLDRRPLHDMNVMWLTRRSTWTAPAAQVVRRAVKKGAWFRGM